MKSKQYSSKVWRRSYLVFTISTLIILAGGMCTILIQRENTQADYGSIIGAPTLPASLVDQIFANMGSPMEGTGATIVAAARSANIDDAFALGVWYAETNDGAAGVGSADVNPGSVRGSSGYPSAYDGYTIYPSYTAAIYDWFSIMENRYVADGLTTVYGVSGPYVGTSGASKWAAKVEGLMEVYHEEAPPPTPTPAPTPTPIIRDKVVISSEPAGTIHLPDDSSESRPGITATDTQTRPQATLATPPSVATGNTIKEEKNTPTDDILIAGVLVSAVLLALFSLKPGRQIPIPAPAIQEGQKTTESLAPLPFAPLYAHQYSPVLEERQTEENDLTPLFVGRAPQHQVAPTPVLAGVGGGMKKAMQPVPPTPVLVGQNVPPTPSLSRGYSQVSPAPFLPPQGQTGNGPRSQLSFMPSRPEEGSSLIPASTPNAGGKPPAYDQAGRSKPSGGLLTRFAENEKNH